MKAWIQRWLGIAALGRAVTEMRLDRLRDREKDAQRHIELVNALSELNKRMTNQHVGQPRQFTPDVLDWDTVQAIAMQQLIANPERES